MARARYRDSIAFRLHGIVATAFVALLALTAVSLHFAQRTRDAASLLMGDGLHASSLATQLDLLLEQHRRMVLSLPAQLDRSRLFTVQNSVRAVNRELVAVGSEMQRANTSEVRALGDQLSRELPDLLSVTDDVLELAVRYRQNASLDMAQGPYAFVAERMQQRISLWRDQRGAILQEQAEGLSASADELISRVVGCAGLVTLLGIVAFVASRRVLRRIERIKSAMLHVAMADTDVCIPSLGRADEIGAVARAVEGFRGNVVRLAAQETALKEAAARFEAALANMSQGLCLYDGDLRLQVVNRRFGEILGIDQARLTPGLSYAEVIALSVEAGNHPGQTVNEIVAARDVGRIRDVPETMMLELSGDRCMAISHCSRPGGGWVATYEDVTARHAAERKVAFMARHDVLTHLPNRLVLNERMAQAVADAGRGVPSAVLCLDLDRFKVVNDTLGHPIGDALLRAVSERLQDLVREVDMVARLGGDEFAILQSGIARPEDAKLLSERIIAAISAPFDVDGHQIVVGISVGIALIPGDGRDPERLLRHADMALYRAKADGRGRFCFFESEMDARLQERRLLELHLRGALAQDQFELHYQPLVHLGRGEVSGFEALLRWRHPVRGLISPAEFIPIIEEIGLIGPVGEWVMRRACRDAATWPGDIRVAVNLSPVQFQDARLADAVCRALADSGLPARRLELEITESVLLQNNDVTMTTLHSLRTLGVRIAMDDFGTGYSSLSYLRSFPFDKVKIDQSFIRDLSLREDSVHVVRAVTGLCAGLGMATTAEGVETAEQLATLRREGCTEVQGYLFSRPRPADEVAGIVARVRELAGATMPRPELRVVAR